MNQKYNLTFKLLQYLKENPNIVIDNESDVAVVKEAMNKDKVLKSHPYKIVEVQKGDILIEEDIIRYEDIYGRV